MKIIYLSEVYLKNDYWGPFHRGFANHLNSIEGAQFIGLNVLRHDKNKVLDCISSFAPDLVIIVNYISISGAVTDYLRKNLPATKICLWLIDSYVRCSYDNLAALKNFDKIFISGSGQYMSFFKDRFSIPDDKVSFLTFSTDPTQFKDLKLERDLDISFVGTLFHNHIIEDMFLKNLSNPSNYKILSEMLESHQREYTFELLEKLRSSTFDFKDFLTTDHFQEIFRFQIAFDDQSSKEKRLRYLSRLHEFNLAIHGEPVEFWVKGILNVDSRLLKHFKHNEKIGNAQQLSTLYNRSKIALNLQHHQAFNFGVAMRVFDVMACKTLLLTEEISIKSLHHLGFEDGSDFISFKDENDLREKVSFYIKNDKKRKKITESAFLKVHQQHTHAKRIKFLLKELNFHKESKTTELFLSNLSIYHEPIDGNIDIQTILSRSAPHKNSSLPTTPVKNTCVLQQKSYLKHKIALCIRDFAKKLPAPVKKGIKWIIKK